MDTNNNIIQTSDHQLLIKRQTKMILTSITKKVSTSVAQHLPKWHKFQPSKVRVKPVICQPHKVPPRGSHLPCDALLGIFAFAINITTPPSHKVDSFIISFSKVPNREVPILHLRIFKISLKIFKCSSRHLLISIQPSRCPPFPSLPNLNM